MKSPVSLEYVVVITLLAIASAVLAYVTPQPVLNFATLLLGIYALHLVSVRIVVRQYAGVAPRRKSRSKGAAETAEELRHMREELDLERAELNNRKKELQERITAAEQQWELLRQMIREKVEGGADLPESVVAASAGGTVGNSNAGRGNGSDKLPRIHGRW